MVFILVSLAKLLRTLHYICNGQSSNPGISRLHTKTGKIFEMRMNELLVVLARIIG